MLHTESGWWFWFPLYRHGVPNNKQNIFSLEHLPFVAHFVVDKTLNFHIVRPIIARFWRILTHLLTVTRESDVFEMCHLENAQRNNTIRIVFRTCFFFEWTVFYQAKTSFLWKHSPGAVEVFKRSVRWIFQGIRSTWILCEMLLFQISRWLHQFK